MTRIYLSVALLFAMLFGDVGVRPCASQTVSLTVDSLFRLIDERSRTIKLKSLSIDDADEGAGAARSRRLLSVGASLSVGYLGNGYLTDRDFSDGMNVRNPHSKNDFAIEAMQVIYSGGTVSGGIRMAELNARMARLDMEQSRQQVRFLFLGWLIDLQCLGNRSRVLDENTALARKVLADMQARYDEGVVLKSDITRYELQVQNLLLQRDKVEEALRTTNYRMANALGFPAGSTTFVPELGRDDARQDTAPESLWQEKALASSMAIKKAELGMDISETNRRLVAADKRPKLSLFAYGVFNSPIVTEVPVIDKNFMYWGFGASLSFNISSLYTNTHRERQARVAVMESREAYDLSRENVRNDVEAAYEAWQTAAAELRTQEKSLELARRNYDIVSDRYTNGMALITDMVDAANVRLSAELGLENARTMLLFAGYKLKYVTNTL